MTVVYGICKMLGYKDPFIANFSAADALATAAMMMIALSQDILEIPDDAKDGWLAVINGETLPYICMALWLMYGALKVASIGLGTSPEDKEKLLLIGAVSIVIALCVVVYGFIVRYKVMSLQLKKS